MLSPERIKEAEANVAGYLEEGLLMRSPPTREVIALLEKNALESIRSAEELKDISSLWVIVCSYYSMYYIANAALHAKGYKVGDKIRHKVTAEALIVYVRKTLKDELIEAYEDAKEAASSLAGIKADDLISAFDHERQKRGKIQYSTTDVVKAAKAETSLKRAKEFLIPLRKMLR